MAPSFLRFVGVISFTFAATASATGNKVDKDAEIARLRAQLVALEATCEGSRSNAKIGDTRAVSRWLSSEESSDGHKGLEQQDAIAVCEFHDPPPEHTCPDGEPGKEGGHHAAHPHIAIIYMCVALLWACSRSTCCRGTSRRSRTPARCSSSASHDVAEHLSRLDALHSAE